MENKNYENNNHWRWEYQELSTVGMVGAIPAMLEHGSIVLLALPGQAVLEFVNEYKDLLTGKMIFDSTNDIKADSFNHYADIKKIIPDVLYVRAFNTLGWENFEQPVIGWQTVDLFYCAPVEAKTDAEVLMMDAGLHPVYVGGLDQIEVVDNLTRLWFALVFQQGYNRHTAIKLLTE
jgi:predicted dinucleotide-binding enzyme